MMKDESMAVLARCVRATRRKKGIDWALRGSVMPSNSS